MHITRTRRFSVKNLHLVSLCIVMAAGAASQSYAAPASPIAETDTLYSAPGGMMTLVAGSGDPGRDIRQPEVLRFTDDQGKLVRVYADHPVDITEARSALAKCRRAKAHAAEVRRELAARGR